MVSADDIVMAKYFQGQAEHFMELALEKVEEACKLQEVGKKAKEEARRCMDGATVEQLKEVFGA